MESRLWLSMLTSPWIVLPPVVGVAVMALYNVAVRNQTLLEGVLRAMAAMAAGLVVTFVGIRIRLHRAEQSEG